MADKFQSLRQLRRSLEEGRDFRITCIDRGSQITVLAPHGGFIEPGTSAIARGIAGDDFNLYDFQGLVREKPYELHVTSTRFRDPALTRLIKKSRLTLSVHGMGKVDRWSVWLGGLDCSTRILVMSALSLKGFRINPNPPKYKGEHRQNVVNLNGRGGVQLELPEDLIDSFFSDAVPFAGPATALKRNSRFVEFTGAVRQGLLEALPERLHA
ncbi:MAG: poly-gamma-glutamate hydrolase family protein [Cyanobacteria bacterium HKST-UBA02]|nr:poly-gamma-glutamate hydrolase family protein [Cyanobacteria bacterium HKST-UBA02]